MLTVAYYSNGMSTSVCLFSLWRNDFLTSIGLLRIIPDKKGMRYTLFFIRTSKLKEAFRRFYFFFSFNPKNVLKRVLLIFQIQRFSRVNPHQNFKMKTMLFFSNSSQSLYMFLSMLLIFLPMKPYVLIYFVLIK